MKLKVTVNGVAYSVDVEVEEEQRQRGTLFSTGSGSGAVNTPAAPTTASVQGVASNAVVAPLAGSVSKVLINEGDTIEQGQVLLVLEAMKMETEITAPAGGTVASLPVSVGESVQGGQVLVEIG
ncbi:biotin/lipoyl-binding protein [Corynebacterium sp. CCM 9185]|uniref:Biotin/lipoyl-binding protein n=1 Tax=Corynebacterium marambiense TaxID=2765364 RepID=A0ABS0VU15_9CORY|nr:biotin/lipoyl-containing protein [Corynebacterium marambiense]MBI9000262.1 biotin/lipoyl-binding protein [Corynebacterium marambiense]MCK7663616.1 biotin/lipoyl-binding protein [Corynebacterium marambiense]